MNINPILLEVLLRQRAQELQRKASLSFRMNRAGKNPVLHLKGLVARLGHFLIRAGEQMVRHEPARKFHASRSIEMR